MRALYFIVGLAAFCAGCCCLNDRGRVGSYADVPKVTVTAGEKLNPLFVKTEDPDYLWESIVDVVDNYFPIPHEYPIQTYKYQGDDGTVHTTQTEGRIDTDPVIAAGLFEPWKKNSVTCHQRTEATFQTIRRSAVVRVVPEQGGYSIHVAVYNELEDMAQPMNAGSNGSNLLFFDDMSNLEYPPGEVPRHEGWIPTGRNTDMEDYLLQEMAWRFQNAPVLINPENANARPRS
ncbi:MAG: hypothetical protein IK105_06425 [Thermoguttaceae bacterium]|nr:hypothetical protein [Thermoguttaceae bacterium]MBR5415554.1 hypothetical protein [Thermoguttaceae bacterium]